MRYLGDINLDTTLSFLWSTNDGDGAAITRATDGTIKVYKDGGTTESTAGVTDTEDFDGMTGIHLCQIDTSSDSFYEASHDYDVVLSGAEIDGQAVNAILAHFSIENRFSLLQATGITEGGTWSLGKILKAIVAWNIGKWQLKDGETDVYEILDPDDGVTVIAEVTPKIDESPFKQVTIL